MFDYGICEKDIRITRRELKKNIHTQHPIAVRVTTKVENLTWKWSGFAWLITFAITFILNAIFSEPTSEFIKAHSAFWPIMDMIWTPVVCSSIAAVIVKFITRTRFYRINNLPIENLAPSSSSFSSSSSYNSTISVNPASGMPMCGSVDINGNAPGHSHRY